MSYLMQAEKAEYLGKIQELEIRLEVCIELIKHYETEHHLPDLCCPDVEVVR